jgi:uncharacterized protein YndB with AHSA1/START domain
VSTQPVVVSKVMPVSREEVFDAWLDGEGMGRWMCPGTVGRSEATLDARVGGGFRILMKAAEAEYVHTGEFLVLDRPSKLQFTWFSPGTDQQETLVTVELHERGEHCEVVLTHERFPREDAAARHQKGWGEILDKLAGYLGGARDDFRLAYEFAAPVDKVYAQFATEAGIRNWWTVFCEMEERVGGRASFRFPSNGFYTKVEITKLEPGRVVEWLVTDSMHPANTGFVDLSDWNGTRIRFEMEALTAERTVLHFTHAGLVLKECLGVCSSAWAFYLNESLRGYLESGAGKPHTKGG